MGSTPPKQRRRWLILAFVFVLVVLCGWLYWPRGDHRFVGTWRVDYFDGSTPTPQFHITYAPNGSMSFDSAPEWLPIHRRWRVDENRLIWATSIPNRDSSSIGDCLARFMHQATGFNQWGREFPFEIVEISDTRISLWDPTDPQGKLWLCNRIPE